MILLAPWAPPVYAVHSRPAFPRRTQANSRPGCEKAHAARVVAWTSQRPEPSGGTASSLRRHFDTGFTILDRNWRCARGEIDIVARDAAALVVCEVKTRSGAQLQFGAPFEAVTRQKLQRLRRLAMPGLDALPSDERDTRS